MFLNERSPFSVKVKTKIAELLILKKMEAIEIHSIYPNIWKKINKKSLYNLEQIKLKIKQELFYIATKYGSITKKNILNKSKSLKKFINTSFGKTNESQVEIDKSKCSKFINSEKVSKKRKTKKNINMPKQNNNIINKVNSGKSKKEEEKIQDINNERKIEINNNYMSKNCANKEILNDSIVQNKIINKLDSINKNKLKIISSKKLNDKDNINNSNKIYSEKELRDFTKNNEKELTELNNSILNTLISNKNLKKEFINEKKYSNIDKISYSLPTKLNHENFIDNESMICNDSNIITQIFQKSTINEIEKKINYFCNLTTMSINSFQLNSSYENINEITNNKYIGDNFLQTKTKQFLLKESSIINIDSLKKNNNKTLLLQNKFYKKMNKSYKKDTCNFNNQLDLESDKKSINSLDISNLKSTKKISININTSEKNKEENVVRSKYESFKKLISRNQSINNILDSPSSKYKGKSPKKRKNDSLRFNKKLNIISKNIKGASKNINNPNKFYMDFFNNIIKQENFDNFKIDTKNNHIIDSKREKSNKLEISKANSISPKKFRNSNFYFSESKQGNTKINRKSTKKF